MSIIEQLRAGVDWLAQTIGNDEVYNAEWRYKCNQWLSRVADSGFPLRERGLLGYRGMSAGNCFVGTREDGHLVQFTGHHAGEGFQQIAHPRANVSRLDLQVTVKYDLMPLDIIDRAYEESASANRDIPNERKRKIWKIVGDQGGETLYIGSWKSAQYGYIYNKEVQSGQPEYGRCWRFEVRFKQQLARLVCDRLMGNPELLPELCATIVSQWFRARGVQVPWSVATGLEPLPAIKSLPTEIERTLWWLERQVKPPLKRLIDAGFMDQALIALGILL